MSPFLFYLALVFFSKNVEFSLLWMIVALLVGGSETIVYLYRYTSDPRLSGKDTKA